MIKPKPQTTLGRLRMMAVLEGISYLALMFVAMPMKYLMQDNSLMRPLGMLHGWLFVLYVLLLLQAHLQLRWGWKISLINLALSFIPFGTFYSERKYFRDGSSSGNLSEKG